MIIALHGPLQCGKSTLARLLKGALPNAKQTAFSNFVREEIVSAMDANALGTVVQATTPDGHPVRTHIDTLWTTYSQFQKEFGRQEGSIKMEEWLAIRPASPASRIMQQWWGQEFRRKQDSNYWIKKHFAAHFSDLQAGTILIEESCRQPNERDYVHLLGGVVIDLAPLPLHSESEAAALSHPVEQIANTWTGDIQVDMGEYFELVKKNQWDSSGWVDKLLRRIQFKFSTVRPMQGLCRLYHPEAK